MTFAVRLVLPAALLALALAGPTATATADEWPAERAFPLVTSTGPAPASPSPSAIA